jgi:hypothetical protein
MRLWYIWHKPCTYLAPKLTLSSNGSKRGSIWASSPRSTIQCIQNNLWAYGTFGANCAPIMHWNLHYLQKDWKEVLREPRHLGFHWVRPKWFLRLWYVWCKLLIYLAPRLTLSPNGPQQDSTWPTSPKSSIGCVQNDFRAYGAFGTNRAPILNHD